MLKANLPQARQMYESAYNLDPNPFLAWKMLAAQAASGQVNEALLQAKKMVLLYPKDAQLHALYGQLLATSGLYEKAVEHYEKAIDLEPSRVEPYIGLIQLYQYQKKTTEAIVIAQEFVKVDPNNGDGWALLAKLYLSTSQKKKALKPAKRAFELQSADSEKILIYALALELNGQSKQAVGLYEQLYRLNPTNEDLAGPSHMSIEETPAGSIYIRRFIDRSNFPNSAYEVEYTDSNFNEVRAVRRIVLENNATYEGKNGTWQAIYSCIRGRCDELYQRRLVDQSEGKTYEIEYGYITPPTGPQRRYISARRIFSIPNLCDPKAFQHNS